MNNEVKNKTNIDKTNINKVNNNDKRLLYTYNQNQKDFFRGKGIKIADAGIHCKTHKIFWAYEYEDVQPYLDEWKELHHQLMELERKIRNK